MNDTDAVPNPEEDLKHAHALLARMSPEELFHASYVLEEIIESSPRFQEKMRKDIAEAESSGWVTTEKLLSDLGLEKEDFPALLPSPDTRNEAA
jgi:hypothetical protein